MCTFRELLLHRADCLFNAALEWMQGISRGGKLEENIVPNNYSINGDTCSLGGLLITMQK